MSDSDPTRTMMADPTGTPTPTIDGQTAAERRSAAAKKAAATRARNRAATARETAERNAERKAAATRAGDRAATARETAERNAERKAAATRAGDRAATARETAERNAERKAAVVDQRRSPAARVQDYAERAVLVQVGATLIARDAIASTVEGLRAKYASPEKAQRELARFERRGATARAQLERELRERRARVESAVQGRLSAGAQVAAKVQERVAGLV